MRDGSLRFLYPAVKAEPDPRVYGVFTTPYHTGVPAWIKQGLPWAADHGGFTKGWRPERYLPWLDETMRPYLDTCLFVCAPDVVADPLATAALWAEWAHHPAFAGYPLAFVAQDGAEALPWPDPRSWHALFVGGSTAWKESQEAIDCIKRAQALGKHIHVGRVNWARRYNLFAQIRGSEAFTCDGTRARYVGYEKAAAAWHKLETQTNTLPMW